MIKVYENAITWAADKSIIDATILQNEFKIDHSTADQIILKLTDDGYLIKLDVKNGALYILPGVTHSSYFQAA